MNGIPNPAISHQDDELVNGGLFDGVHQQIIEGTGENILDPATWQTIPLSSDTIAIVFNKTEPIAPQIRLAENALRKVAEPKRERAHSKKWLGYLRVLDGRETGASWAELARVLLDEARREKHYAPQSAKQMWQQARAVMFSWPD